MSNWTTTEFNFVKSALSLLKSNHEDIQKDIAGMRKATNLQMENTVNSIKVQLENSINITLNENDIINSRMDDITVKSDLYSIQNMINTINTAITKQAEGINSVNGTIHTEMDVITTKLNEVNTRLDKSTVSIKTTMNMMNITQNERMENMNNVISERIDTAINLLTKNMNDAVNAMVDNVNVQLSMVINQTRGLIDFRDAQLRAASHSAFVLDKCKQYIAPGNDMFSWLVSCTRSLDGWLTIQRLIHFSVKHNIYLLVENYYKLGVISNFSLCHIFGKDCLLPRHLCNKCEYITFRRVDGFVSFARNWKDYTEGFGIWMETFGLVTK